MPQSEIDDIFASKGKAKAALKPQPEPSSSTKSKPEKKRKRKHQATSIVTSSSAPETVVDPSIKIPTTKRQKVTKDSADTKTKATKKAEKTSDNDGFTDSRGTGPRRKTEEGWSVFKEDELGINDEGGGNLYSEAFLRLMSTSYTDRYAFMSIRLSML
ncbi:hypothetical protein AAF712_001035 [Marasmius tenuissimus]|uniref:Uncharacterized protein n=1 Tax=Marasmius tenuissimus TaxID=585030 RepID=A0ABR3AFG1_9AGAR|nr:hypothetical protein PM082_002942 [Marasmius tenuissimus]